MPKNSEILLQLEELRSATANVTAILEALPDLLFDVDEEGRIFDYRAPRPQQLYAPPEHFLGKTVREVLPESAASAIMGAIAEAARVGRHGGVVYSLEVGGRTLWFEITIAAKRGLVPPRRFIVLAREITERKETQEQLRRASNELDKFFNVAPDLFCIADQEGRFLRLNPAWQDALGYRLEELEGAHFLDFVHAGDRDATVATTALAAVNQISSFTNRYRCKDGSYRWMEWRSIPSGGLVIAAARDVTANKEAERELAERDFWLRESQRVSRIGSYVLDVASGFWTSSEMLDEIFGIGPEYVRSIEGWEAIVHPDDRSAMAEYFQREVLGERKPFNREYRIVRQSDGEARWLLGRGELLADQTRKLIKMTGTIQDITERKVAEAVLLLALQRILFCRQVAFLHVSSDR